MRIIKTLSESEYTSVQILRAVGEEKRFIILKNLRVGGCYAHELAKALKISRTALEKHARILIHVNLVEKKILLEKGRAKSVFNISELGEKILDRLDGVTSEIEEYGSRIVTSLRNKLTEVSTQIDSLKSAIQRLSKRYQKNEIEKEVYNNMKVDYENQLSTLIAEASKIKKKIRTVQQQIFLKY